MQITIPDDAIALARTQAEAAGFSDLGAYLANLIRRQPPAKQNGAARTEAIDDLRKLRRELPKLSPPAIVDLVREARAELL